jgi:tetratricopeptide (TPR) repeat protein
MNRSARIILLFSMSIGLLAAAPAGAQGFGASKEKVTLHRRLPAVIHLPGDTIKVVINSSDAEEDGALPYDFQALLETELLKDDANLREDDNPAVEIICEITEYSHPDPEYTNKLAPAAALGGTSPIASIAKAGEVERITGKLNVSFQAKLANGRTLISDNVQSTYDQEFDAAGNSTAHGVFGQVAGSLSHAKGGQKSEDGPPTPAELRSRLIIDAVQQVAEHVVDSDESIDVLLARKDGPLEEGDKDAETGLWERALETYETATPFPKPDEDAYRLYDIGVAYEALAYEADDEKAAMKYLDQAAINYGKAIDAKPTEKYFVEPQKRIETAIAHYKELDLEKQRAAADTDDGNSKAQGLTNAQVITMLKSGIDESAVLQAIRGASAVNFDLTPAGQKSLTAGGVSPRILAEMKTQAARKPAAVAHKGLNNNQIITMVKSGMEEATIIQAINGASAIDFDLSPDGQQALLSGGVSAHVLDAMKARSAKKPAAGSGHVAQK